jgi:hypothetical protein
VGTEQRTDIRVGYKSQAVVLHGGKKHTIRTINLSRGGIKVIAPRELSLSSNEQIEVQLTFSWTSEWVRIPAHFVYESTEDGFRCWGLRFRNLPKDARILISLFVAGQNPKPPPRTSSARSRPSSRTS